MGAQRVRHNLSTKQQQTLSQYFLNVTSISHLIGGRREEGDRRWDGISRHEFEQTPDRLKDREMVQIHGVSKSRAQLSNWTTTKYLETCLAHNRCLKMKVKSLSRVQLFVTPGTVAYQAPPSTGFSRQEYWSGLPFPSPGYLPNPGVKPGSPAFQADALTSEPPGKPSRCLISIYSVIVIKLAFCLCCGCCFCLLSSLHPTPSLVIVPPPGPQ